MTSPNQTHQHQDTLPVGRAPQRFWLAWLYFFVAIVLAGGFAVSYLTWRASVAEVTRISESLDYAEFIEQQKVVDQDTFYQGVLLDGADLSGLTWKQASALAAKLYTNRAAQVAVTLQIDDQKLVLGTDDLGWQDDTNAALERAWNYARTSESDDEREQVRERFLKIEQLKTNPVNFKISQSYDPALAIAAIRSFVSSQQTAAKPAMATGFDIKLGRFILAERVTGRRTDPAVFQELVLTELDRQNFTAKIAVESDKTEYGMTKEVLEQGLVLISTANTYAYAVDLERDNNLQKAAEYLNGTVIQPGATFSFNEMVGQRTAERGFMEAGAISDGILQKELGGGVCQVNTTVMQAAMISDYELVERYPHSWPSSYTKVGLDATIDWGGADFKFANNSDYPVAIVATYVKPKLSVKIYGRKLEEGVTISLRSEETEIIPVEAPIYRPDNTLAPGQVVEIRAPHVGKRAIAYKVYTKDKVVLKEEVLFKSYYRPLQGIYDVGPAVTVTQVDPSSAISATAGIQD